jgi:hypothetical protein
MIKPRRMKWAEHVALMGKISNGYRVLVGKPNGRSLLRRTRRRSEDDINMDLREIG